MRLVRLAMILAVGLWAGATQANAQDTLSGGGMQYDLGLGGGLLYQPKYPGADDYILVPYPIVAVGRVYVPFIGQFDTTNQPQGFYFFPSFAFHGERKPSDDPSLKGTKKVPWTLELGLGAGVRNDWLRGYASVRQGINGTDGQVGNFGFDVIVPVTERIRFAAGPRASWASKSYMNTYFGVTGAEASAGSLSKYRADGGFYSAGIAATATYRMTDRTSLHLRGSWDRLINDAGDSPIVKAGSKDQWTVGVGLSHKFDFNLFR